MNRLTRWWNDFRGRNQNGESLTDMRRRFDTMWPAGTYVTSASAPFSTSMPRYTATFTSLADDPRLAADPYWDLRDEDDDPPEPRDLAVILDDLVAVLQGDQDVIRRVLEDTA